MPGRSLPAFVTGAALATVSLAACASPAPLASQPVHSPSASASAGPTRPYPTAVTSASGAVRSATTAASTGPTPVDSDSYKEAPTSTFLRYAFDSPSGAIHCAISDGQHGFSETGCQGSFVVPTLPQCDKPDSYGPMVRFVAGTVKAECTTQGIFVGEPGRKVLPYGSSITAMGYTCVSQPTGISCVKVATSQRFTMSSEALTTQG